MSARVFELTIAGLNAGRPWAPQESNGAVQRQPESTRSAQAALTPLSVPAWGERRFHKPLPLAECSFSYAGSFAARCEDASDEAVTEAINNFTAWLPDNSYSCVRACVRALRALHALHALRALHACVNVRACTHVSMRACDVHVTCVSCASCV